LISVSWWSDMEKAFVRWLTGSAEMWIWDGECEGQSNAKKEQGRRSHDQELEVLNC
jgi:hypothetical protein